MGACPMSDRRTDRKCSPVTGTDRKSVSANLLQTMVNSMIRVSLLLLIAAHVGAAQVRIPGPGGIAPSGGGGGHAPTYLHSGAASTGGSDCILTANVTAGDFLLIYGMSTTVTSNTLSVSDTNSNTYTAAIAQTTTSDNLTINRVWTGTASTTNAALSITVNVTSTTNSAYCLYEQYSGTSVALDQISLRTLTPSTSPMVTGTTGTTTQANEEVIGLYGLAVVGGFDITADTGFSFGDLGTSPVTNSSDANWSEHKAVSATGTYAVSSAITTPANLTGGAGITVTLKAN